MRSRTQPTRHWKDWQMKKFKIIPIFVPHRGCPHQCSFCNQRHITGAACDVTAHDARQIIEKYLSTIDTNKHRAEVAFYGGSFTAIDPGQQNELLDVALEYKNAGKIQGIRLSTRPDAISCEILDNLKSKKVTEIELGVQSMCDDVLLANKRGHTAADVQRAVDLIREYDFSLGLQMMVGLLGDSMEKSLYTAKKLIELSPDFVRIYPTLVFRDTDLYDEYVAGRYAPLTLEQAAQTCAPLVRLFEQASIKIIRLGLLVTEDEAKENLVAGPYHPRFREIVYDIIEKDSPRCI